MRQHGYTAILSLDGGCSLRDYLNELDDWAREVFSMAFITCDGCNRLLREEDGPTCADCLAEQRSEAASKAAKARWDKEREDESTEKAAE